MTTSSDTNSVEPFAIASSIPVLEPIAAKTQDDYDEAPHKLNKRDFVLVYVSLMLAVFMYCLDNTIILPALSFILGEFSKEMLLPWLGVYMLTAAPFGILYGKFSGIFSKKWVFVSALVIFLVGSLICATAPSMEVLIFGRAIAGIGGGGLLPLSYIVVSDITSSKDRGKYMAGLGAMVGAGNTLGPFLGGLFTDHLNWRWCFYLNLPVGFLNFIFVVLYCNIPRAEGDVWDKVKRVDFLGSFVLLCTLMAFNIPILLGGTTWAWGSPQVIVLLIISVLGLILLAYIEFRVAIDPVVPPPIWQNSFIVAMAGISFFVGGGIQSTFIFFSLFLEYIDNYKPLQVGGVTCVVCVFYIVVTMFSGSVFSKKGRYVEFFIAGPIIWAAACVWISHLTKDFGAGHVIGSSVILGIGIGTMVQLRISALQLNIDKEFVPIATGICTSTTNIGANVIVSIIGTILNNLIIAKTDGSSELHAAIDFLNFREFQVDVVQYITLAKLLEVVPKSATFPQNATVLFEIAADQLKTGFNEAYKYSFLSQLSCFVGILALVPFIWPKRKAIDEKP
ncbi:hypothetical protein HDU79_004149 [Rhizoclosmatium sp. JEL0117]|nr:hypothetical protein HDU79_004149 [Rhizoclosmatium sp. JEL0117]